PLVGCAAPPGGGEVKSSLDRVDASSYVDKVTAGYQGWFTAGSGWTHWSWGGAPRPGRVSFELYPDTREYAPSDLSPTELGPLGDGRPASLFTSTRPGVADTHFRWMAEHGIDGVGLQRFVVGVPDPGRADPTRDTGAVVRTAAERWGRIFYIEYDLSGARDDWAQRIKDDWRQTIVGQLRLTDSPQYARQG